MFCLLWMFAWRISIRKDNKWVVSKPTQKKMDGELIRNHEIV